MTITVFICPIALYELYDVGNTILDFCKVGTSGTITFTTLSYAPPTQRASVILNAPEDTYLPFLHAFIQHHLLGGFLKTIDLYSYTLISEVL